MNNFPVPPEHNYMRSPEVDKNFRREVQRLNPYAIEVGKYVQPRVRPYLPGPNQDNFMVDAASTARFENALKDYQNEMQSRAGTESPDDETTTSVGANLERVLSRLNSTLQNLEKQI
jgi:hypothetical protein